MAFNVAKIASARASLTISLMKSLRVAGPYISHHELTVSAVISKVVGYMINSIGELLYEVTFKS